MSLKQIFSTLSMGCGVLVLILSPAWLPVNAPIAATVFGAIGSVLAIVSKKGWPRNILLVLNGLLICCIPLFFLASAIFPDLFV